jgi:tetratricopeptide (TPR) repeat protein
VPQSQIAAGVLLLAGSAAVVLADPRTIGRIDHIEPGTLVVQHTSLGKTNRYDNTLCPQRACELAENDVLDIQKGSARFTIREGANAGKWTCGPQDGIRIRSMGATCGTKLAFAEGVPAGPGDTAWNALYRPESKDRENVSAWMMGGLIFEKAGRYAEAREQYRHALDILPESGWIQHELDRMAALDRQKNAGPRPMRRKLAVVIGVSEYLWHPEFHLPGASPDASWFGAFLSSKRGGVEKGDIIQLTEARANIAAIRRSLRDVLRIKARPGDTVVIYITGHAIQRAQEAFLYGYDSRREEPRTLYPLDELLQMSKDAGDIGIQVILFADFCYAGALQNLKHKGTSLVPEALRGNVSTKLPVWGIAASGVSEKAWELRVEGLKDKFQGVFTRYLMEGLHSSAGPISSDVLWSYVQGRMSKDSNLRDQHPVEIGSSARSFTVSEAGPQEVVSHTNPDAQNDVERFLPGQPSAQWARLRDASGEEAGQKQFQLSASLERAGDALLDEYLSGEEIPQSASDFQVGAEIYSVLSEMAARGKAIEDTPLLQVRRRFFEAMALLRAGKSANAQEAVKLLDQARQWDDNAGYIYNALGQAYAQQEGRDADNPKKEAWQKARAAFEDAILLNPDWPYPRHNLAVMNEVEAQDDRATKRFQEAIDHALAMGKEPASDYYSLGRLLHARNDFSSARQYNGLAHKAFHSLTLRYQDLETRCKGCSTYARIIRGFRAGEAQAWNALGILEHDDHHDDRAIADFEHGRALLPDAPENALVRSNILFNLIRLRSLNNKNGAGQRIEDLKALIATDKNYVPAIFELALLHQNSSQQDAENEFRRVTQLQPESTQGWQGLVKVQRDQGHTMEAQETLQLAMQQLDPESFRELTAALSRGKP